MNLNTSLPYLPAPPRLHWAWVLVLSAVTLGVFGMIWLLVQANWIKRVQGKSRGRMYIFAWLGLLAFTFVMGAVLTIAGFDEGTMVWRQFDAISRLASIVLWLLAVYKVRSELMGAPFNISLGSVMTFFFGTVYFQYWLQDFDNVTHPVDFTSGQPQFPQL